MNTQNLLIGAMTYLLKFQTTKCPTARERALMMFDALANLQDSGPEIQTLCYEANELLAT
jgi:predicted transcriptional regulator